MDLKSLKNPLPFKWKIQSFNKEKTKASCVAYIDARVVMDILDEVCGAENWQTDHQHIKNSIYCSLSIKIDGEWVKKTDAGAPSQTEADKGEASDALKRAAVQWGIGRFLYEKEIVWVKYDSVNKKALDDNGKLIYDLSKHINENNKITPKAKPAVNPPKPVKTAEEEMAFKIIYKLKTNLPTNLEDAKIWLLENEAKITPNLFKEATELITLKEKENQPKIEIKFFDQNYVN